MAHISCLITCSPSNVLRMQEAINTLTGLIATGCTVESVFFYASGVLNANSLINPPVDEFNPHSAWSMFSQQHQVPLLVCVSAAEKRGVIDAALAEQNAQSAHNLIAPFEQVGLGEFFTRLHNVDQLIQY
ncbi:sulfurtransferase complex subunit TusD [Alteromonas flava]|uniref:sulfurtransferase complex subunit TusD n=1 Tax=Alteromonas flava TaxID=2048003 RepID=UPI000C284EE3|nr:sulfurtransferase complex subunit TusD [Alteromonas flava]